ncbi:MAG: 4-hydroxy-tetrahydrodipicolinate reductase, partial [Gammaproteobacteria bacterium]
MTKIAIAGAAGRMGRTLIELAAGDQNLIVSAAFEHAQSDFVGQDAGRVAGLGDLNLPIADSISANSDFDVLIDFTLPESTVENVKWCQAARKAMVIGTTGLGDQQQVIYDAGAEIPIVFAPNMSV